MICKILSGGGIELERLFQLDRTVPNFRSLLLAHHSTTNTQQILKEIILKTLCIITLDPT